LDDRDVDELPLEIMTDTVLSTVKVGTGVSVPLIVPVLFVDAVLAVAEF
jgi:hypothetical protein